jgi:uncharacterized membrane protein YqjE
MAVIQAILAFVTRSAGKILNAIFGWAVHALFGRTSPRDQTFLSAVVAAAVAWPLLLVGVAAPKLATVVLAFVPLSHKVPSGVVRIVWIALAALVPLVVGVAIAARGREPARRGSLVRRLLRGFPLTLGLALAFLIMFVSVPVMRFVALVRGQKSVDVPLAATEGAYQQVATTVVQSLNEHGFTLMPAEPGWWVEAPMRILAWFGGSAFEGFVPAHIEHHEDGSLQVSFYTSGALLRGKGLKLTWAHGLIEEVTVRTDGLQTISPEAQELEHRIRRVWQVFERDPAAHVGSSALRARVDEIGARLATLDVEYDEWQAIYRQLLQLDRELRGEGQLLEAKESNMKASEQTEVDGRPLARSSPERAPAQLSTPELVKTALAELGELAKTHVALARAELRADVKAELAAAKGLAIGGIAALLGVNLLLVTGILALSLVMPAWGAGLVVTGAVLLIAAIVAGIGWKRLVRDPIHRTRHELKEDVRWTKEQMA